MMWVCVKDTDTPCGWVRAGRVVEDGDPMLDGAEPGVWERLVVESTPFEAPVIEEATAEPGRVRRTARKAVK